MALLEFPETPPLSTGSDRPLAFALGNGVILIAWDVEETVRAPGSLSMAGGVAVAPTASLRLARNDGGTRMLWALRRPERCSLEMTLSTDNDGRSTAFSIPVDQAIGPIDPEMLLDSLQDRAVSSFLSTLLTLWGGLFRLQRNPLFIRNLAGLFRHTSPSPLPASAIASSVDDVVLLQMPYPASAGRADAVFRIGRQGILRLPGLPFRSSIGKGREVLHLLTKTAEVGGSGEWLALVGADGLQVRAFAPVTKKLPSLTAWLRDHAKHAATLREHLLIELSTLTGTGPAAALEAQLSAPLDRQRVGNGTSGLGAEITCALSTSAGTLVTGWYRDPMNLVAGIASVGRDGAVHDLTDAVRRFPVVLEPAGGGGRIPTVGFAALAPSVGGTAPILQPRFRLLLKSGAYHPLVPALQPVDPAEARAAALKAVPPQHVDESLLSEILAPVIADLHDRARKDRAEPQLVCIGQIPARPRVSVVIPLYKALDFLRFQMAAFATDPWFRNHAELIYVLDSPEQAVEVEHLLKGLHLVYGLPIVLAVMPRNGGYARACNAGAAAARGEILALVNSDVIPVGPGWLQGLAARLEGRKRIGAVGPKLLFEDGSLQHAGMYFAQDHHGRWLNHHYFKGMPRHYAPATEQRLVPAVTGACLVMSRALFEKVGGFSDDYVVGDYEDSDLCLKITAADRRILYVPTVELYHLERKSMALNAEYMRGVAWQYNCALHGSRWGDIIANVMNIHNRTVKRSQAA